MANAAVLMSPAMQFDDPVSLQNSNFSHDVTNYAPNNLSAASPINVLASHAAPIFLMAFQQDSMPAPQYLLTSGEVGGSRSALRLAVVAGARPFLRRLAYD